MIIDPTILLTQLAKDKPTKSDIISSRVRCADCGRLLPDKNFMELVRQDKIIQEVIPCADPMEGIEDILYYHPQCCGKEGERK
jgi:hypothetical protein